MARYHEIADDLRARIAREEWAVGDQLPGIADLQHEYGAERSLNTVRAAQQLLVADGMLRTVQGRGAFVTATEPIHRDADLAKALTAAQEYLELAQAAVARRAQGKITFDLAAGDTTYVLTTALREFAQHQHDAAQDDDAGEPAERAELAEAMIQRIGASNRWAVFAAPDRGIRPWSVPLRCLT